MKIKLPKLKIKLNKINTLKKLNKKIKTKTK